MFVEGTQSLYIGQGNQLCLTGHPSLVQGHLAEPCELLVGVQF